MRRLLVYLLLKQRKVPQDKLYMICKGTVAEIDISLLLITVQFIKKESRKNCCMQIKILHLIEGAKQHMH